MPHPNPSAVGRVLIFTNYRTVAFKAHSFGQGLIHFLLPLLPLFIPCFFFWPG
ncbi:MAG: hypothetical protein JWP78_4018 [Mucilaginibacter sp.]|nr:hypothetical protein [Mucilaginibacter sp.]